MGRTSYIRKYRLGDPMSQLMYYDTASSSWKPVVVGAQGVTGTAGLQGLQGITGSAGTSAYATYFPVAALGHTSTASVSIPAGSYLYETPSTNPATFTINGNTPVGNFGKLTLTSPATSITGTTPSAYPIAFQNTNTGYQYAAYGNNIYLFAQQYPIYSYSTNGGATWITSSDPSIGAYGYSYGLAYGNGNFVRTWQYNQMGNNFTYSSDGVNWAAGYFPNGGPSSLSSQFGNNILYDVSNSNFVLFPGYSNFYTYGDPISGWTNVYGAPWSTAQAISNVNGYTFVCDASTGNVYYSSFPAGNSWTTSAIGPFAYSHYSSVQWDGTNYWVAVGISNGNVQLWKCSNLSTNTWTQVSLSWASYTGNDIEMIVSSNEILLIEYNNSTAMYSSDEGSTFSSVPTGIKQPLIVKKLNTKYAFGSYDYNSQYPTYLSSSLAPQQQPSYVKLTSTYTAS